MKTQAAVIVLEAFFLLTALITNVECITGTISGRKRELERKVCVASSPFTLVVLLNVTDCSWEHY